MPLICYRPQNFSKDSLAVIAQANQIIAEYRRQGFDLTLRQLYYQFVARDLIKNNMQEYKRLGRRVNDGRLAGLIDWDAIVDRTRNLQKLSHWDNPAGVIASAAYGYHRDLWATQPLRVEVWIEKDALVGVIEGVCERHDVPYFSCRGNVSQSEMWAAAMRHKGYRNASGRRQDTIVLHLGDHDPNGIDMTRDMQDRLLMFQAGTDLRRIALNIDQVRKYDPPPNFVKEADSRTTGYRDQYGEECWELDALEPQVISELIDDHITTLRDDPAWTLAYERQERERDQLNVLSARYDDVVEWMREGSEE